MTNSVSSSQSDSPAAIDAAFPGWHCWRPKRRDGEPSSWAATLRDESAGVDPTVVANTAEELRAALADQRDLVERSGRRPVAMTDAFPADSEESS